MPRLSHHPDPPGPRALASAVTWFPARGNAGTREGPHPSKRTFPTHQLHIPTDTELLLDEQHRHSRKHKRKCNIVNRYGNEADCAV